MALRRITDETVGVCFRGFFTQVKVVLFKKDTFEAAEKIINSLDFCTVTFGLLFGFIFLVLQEGTAIAGVTYSEV